MITPVYCKRNSTFRENLSMHRGDLNFSLILFFCESLDNASGVAVQRVGAVRWCFPAFHSLPVPAFRTVLTALSSVRAVTCLPQNDNGSLYKVMLNSERQQQKWGSVHSQGHNNSRLLPPLSTSPFGLNVPGLMSLAQMWPSEWLWCIKTISLWQAGPVCSPSPSPSLDSSHRTASRRVRCCNRKLRKRLEIKNNSPGKGWRGRRGSWRVWRIMWRIVWRRRQSLDKQSRPNWRRCG